MTEAQQSAVDSGITSEKVATYDAMVSGGGGYQPDGETITLNENDELEATNVAIWRFD